MPKTPISNTIPGNPKQFGIFDFTSRQSMDDLFNTTVEQIDPKTGQMKAYNPIHWDADGVIDGLTDTNDAESLAAKAYLQPLAAAKAQELAVKYKGDWPLKAQEEWEQAISILCLEYHWAHMPSAPVQTVKEGQTEAEKKTLQQLEPLRATKYVSAAEINASLDGRIPVLEDVPAADYVCRHVSVKALEYLKYCEDAKADPKTWASVDRPANMTRTPFEMCTGINQYGRGEGARFYYHAFVRAYSETRAVVEPNVPKGLSAYVYRLPTEGSERMNKNAGDAIVYAPPGIRFNTVYSGGVSASEELMRLRNARMGGQMAVKKIPTADLQKMSRLDYLLARNQRAFDAIPARDEGVEAFHADMQAAADALANVNMGTLVPMIRALENTTSPELRALRQQLELVETAKHRGFNPQKTQSNWADAANITSNVARLCYVADVVGLIPLLDALQTTEPTLTVPKEKFAQLKPQTPGAPLDLSDYIYQPINRGHLTLTIRCAK